MEESKTIARPYAKAVFDIALANKQLNEWSKFLQACSQVVSNSEMANLISSPGADVKALAKSIYELAIEIANTKENKSFLSFVVVLAGNARLRVVSEISNQFDSKKRIEEGVVEVTITSAIDIGDESLSKIKQALKEKLNKSIEVIVEKDEQLIGGATIRVGDHMIDGSVRSQLSNLNRFLIN
jgi:F-type H+-transporting ATPase subunit delta